MHDQRTERSEPPDERPNNGMRALLGEADYEALYSPQTQMARALAKVKRPEQTYAGTVPYATKQARRVRNRVARRSRKTNRGVR